MISQEETINMLTKRCTELYERLMQAEDDIELMKCCENCKQFENPERIQVGFGDWKDICDYCNKNDRWELAK